MSAEINNREYRKEVLRQIIAQLHDGKSVEDVQARFAEVFGQVSAEEIVHAEQALIDGGLPVAEVQRLCDVHSAVFKGSIEEIHQHNDLSSIPGHPVHTLKLENKALIKVIKAIEEKLSHLPDDKAEQDIKDNLEKLAQVDKHYLKKENLFFPYMEKYGITSPPKVMWGVDDEIRAELKAVISKVQASGATASKAVIKAVTLRISEMIFKEENIMLPMLTEKLSLDEWKKIADESGELGYCLIDNVAKWEPAPSKTMQNQKSETLPKGVITLPTGVLKTEELIGLLNILPFDITFVDKDDTVRYFSQGVERIFPRTTTVIGRKVSNCHPPASAHIVEALVEDFRNGVKDHEDFWINMGDKYIYIRYFAVRNDAGEFIGVVEVTQNIKPIQEIKGEKRLVNEE